MSDTLILNEKGYFSARGLDVLVFNNVYDSPFNDAKLGGVEIIHHGVRTATNGDVRLLPTPEQWDAIPHLEGCRIDKSSSAIEASLSYAEYDFAYTIRVQPHGEEITVAVHCDAPLPPALEGRAGFNVEFLPAAYFGKSFLMDDRTGTFPLHPTGPMAREASGVTVPLPLSAGHILTLAPEDPERRIRIASKDQPLALFDGRNKAQNGWFVVRTLIPSNQTGEIVQWTLQANRIQAWTRRPVIAHSQLGYHPRAQKRALIELDLNDTPLPAATVVHITQDGERAVCDAQTQHWGTYLRYAYLSCDFSAVQEPGLYALEYGSVRTAPFRISPDIYAQAWHPSLDVFLPVQMDHMRVREAYRVWHGAAHLDDALQAPVDHTHFDMYAQGPTTDTPFAPGEHIPGLNDGGWFDAGDFDIRTQTQYGVVLHLVHAWEDFGIDRDQTTVDWKTRSVEIHVPDGIPDVIQQIEHGTRALLAPYRSVGHAVNGIVEATLRQYAHLGDAVTSTDNEVSADDRWAFTSKSTPLDYGSAAALAAACRALRGFNDALADECLATARRVWADEHSHAPDLFSCGNTTGGKLEDEELKAAVELLLTTGDVIYAQGVERLWETISSRFTWVAPFALRAIPRMPESFGTRMRPLAQEFAATIGALDAENPFGVPITTGGWAGNRVVLDAAITCYLVHKAFPDILPADRVIRGLDYLHGCHPGSDVSFVSGVGTQSKRVAYGNNRADFTFIAGGVVPGVLIVKPDFPENKEDWPFLWAENEYVVDDAARYIYLAAAAHEMFGPGAV